MCTSNANQNMLFMFFAKKLKKGRKSKKIAAKVSKKLPFFKFAPNHWSRVLFTEKTCVHRQKHNFRLKGSNKLPLQFFIENMFCV